MLRHYVQAQHTDHNTARASAMISSKRILTAAALPSRLFSSLNCRLDILQHHRGARQHPDHTSDGDDGGTADAQRVSDTTKAPQALGQHRRSPQPTAKNRASRKDRTGTAAAKQQQCPTRRSGEMATGLGGALPKPRARRFRDPDLVDALQAMASVRHHSAPMLRAVDEMLGQRAFHLTTKHLCQACVSLERLKYYRQ